MFLESQMIHSNFKDSDSFYSEYSERLLLMQSNENIMLLHEIHFICNSSIIGYIKFFFNLALGMSLDIDKEFKMIASTLVNCCLVVEFKNYIAIVCTMHHPKLKTMNAFQF